jgi:hypothetical protein
MTYREDFTLPAELLERVSKQGFDILPELIQVIINAAMQAERQQYLKAESYGLNNLVKGSDPTVNPTLPQKMKRRTEDGEPACSPFLGGCRIIIIPPGY